MEGGIFRCVNSPRLWRQIQRGCSQLTVRPCEHCQDLGVVVVEMVRVGRGVVRPFITFPGAEIMDLS